MRSAVRIGRFITARRTQRSSFRRLFHGLVGVAAFFAYHSPYLLTVISAVGQHPSSRFSSWLSSPGLSSQPSSRELFEPTIECGATWRKPEEQLSCDIGKSPSSRPSIAPSTIFRKALSVRLEAPCLYATLSEACELDAWASRSATRLAHEFVMGIRECDSRTIWSPANEGFRPLPASIDY